MRELDHMLLGWFELGYCSAPEAQKAAFRRLLELPDPDLIGYLLGAEIPDEADLADVVNRILDRAEAS